MKLKTMQTALAMALLAAGSNAHAVACEYNLVTYAGGAYGTETEALQGGCQRPVDGGIGIASSSQSSSGVDGSRMSASASLASGMLTAYSSGGAASSTMWDTITFSNVPSAGALVTASLSLTGSMTGSASGSASVYVGSGVGDAFNWIAESDVELNAASGVPATVQAAFEVHDNDSVVINANLLAYATDGVADLGDPPTLSLILPAGITYTSASGVFGSAAAVPEPGSAALILSGLALLGAAARRRVTAPAGLS